MARERADIAALNHIAAILVDGRRLYARAARLASEDADVVRRIEQTIGERAQLLDNVHARVRTLGGQPQTEGSMLGIGRLAFLDVRAVFDRDTEAALLAIDRAERTLRDEVRGCMRRDDLSAETRAFFGVMLDRIVTGEMRIEGQREETRHEQRPQV